MRALALLLLLLPTAACEGGGGAVSVRWRLIDLQSGVGYDPKTYDGPDGVCRCGQSISWNPLHSVDGQTPARA